MNTGHWKWSGPDFDIDKYLGFVYSITNTKDGRQYIGRKQFWFKRGKHWYESDWGEYTGSSKWLTTDIARLGKQAFTFEIRSLHKSKSSLRYAETRAIVDARCLEKGHRYYNRSFEGMRGMIRGDCLDEFR